MADGYALRREPLARVVMEQLRGITQEDTGRSVAHGLVAPEVDDVEVLHGGLDAQHTVLRQRSQATLAVAAAQKA